MKSLCSLCRTCAEGALDATCEHNDNERAFTSVYTLPEIAFACLIGYKVLRWHEVYAYHRTDHIFRKFLQVLSSYKVRLDRRERLYCLDVKFIHFPPLYFRSAIPAFPTMFKRIAKRLRIVKN